MGHIVAAGPKMESDRTSGGAASPNLASVAPPNLSLSAENFRMKSTTTSMLACFTLLLATPALAQESSRADFDELCVTMQGRWVGNVVWVADWPGFGKKGEKVKCYAEIKVVEDGNALLGRYYGGSGSGTWITFYDAASRKITQTGVGSGGTTRSSVYYKDNGKWIRSVEGSNPDGKKLKGDVTITISEDGNKHTWSGTTTIGGEPNDPLQDVWVRVSDK